MKKILQLVTLFLLASSSIFAQNEEPEYKPAPIPDSTTPDDNTSENDDEDEINNFPELYFVGGQVGFLIGNQTRIDLNPVFGIGIMPKLRAGLGPTYTYISFRENNNQEIKYNLIGGRAFVAYDVFSGIFVQTEYDNQILKGREATNRIQADFPQRLMVGGGYNSAGLFSEGVNASIELLYDVLHTDQDPRNALSYRASIYFAF